ncbi:uncharacterized protein [Aegilops tauschii subsp. strangulata]|uniref:uncharacterized protein n=1 Tax=Aegilops tauschii subsp. strangulata TaxID=200361 RepID=UPI003CC8AC00
MMVIAVGQFLLALVACSTHVVVCSSHGNATDRLSLLEFKEAISLDPQQALMSWNDSSDFCNWEGVSCRPKNRHRVTSLDLSGRGLQGRISLSLGNLTFLRNLSLPRNLFIGQIPASLGHLQHLQNLYLSNNTLEGEIPDFANCSSLQMLWLDRNHLVGKIPTHANFPPHLQSLLISYNNLTGKIPVSLFNVTTLTRLDISSNRISGEIPSEIGNMPMLQFFFAWGNKLSGRFQPAILNVSSLAVLSLASNYLSGQLPSNLGSSSPNLQKFGLFNNLFDGPIPNSLVNASKLSLVDLLSNNFTGVVPSSIGKLKELSWLNLEYNQLQAHDKQDWEFMNSLSNCTELQKLSLRGNRLEGRLSDTFANLSAKLEMFFFGRNRLSGGFPAGIANLHSLEFLALDENQFTGVIPEWLGTLESLRVIVLRNNAFTGYTPSSLSNLSLMGELFLDSNQLYGHIPPSLGNLKTLESLELSNNILDGSIPKEIFSIPTIREIALSSNSLGGPLPTEVGRAKQLQYLYLSSNNLSSGIPDTLGNCDSMEYIELDQNFLSGSIPASLGSIRNLQVLNVSHNRLSGSIPKSIGSLMYLEQLDLSFNRLEGEVPEIGIFKNVTASWVDGNKGLCGGAAKLHLPACPVIPSNSTKHVTSTVLKVVIPLVSMVSLAVVISVLLFWRRKRKKIYMSLPSFGRKFPRVSCHDLDRATDGFSTSNLIGRGGYSSVYKGRLLQDGTIVAVKVFTLETRGAQKSFIAECNALRNVRHRNLDPILTACSSIDSKGNDFKALVYEFMPKGDLHALLYSALGDENTSNSERITLAQRLSIVVDVADALEYLHHDNQGAIVHCDLKPSNILLDDNMTAHVGDFGLARFKAGPTQSYFGDSNSASSTVIKGTIGYVAPGDWATGGEVSVAGDIYSYGIILLETFLRKRPTEDMFKDGLSITNFVEMNFPAGISQIVDSDLLQDRPVATKEKDLDCLVSVLNVGFCCTKLSPSERPNMHEVAASLHGV